MDTRLFGEPCRFGDLQPGDCFAFGEASSSQGNGPDTTYVAVKSSLGATVLGPKHPLSKSGPKELSGPRFTSTTHYRLPKAQIVPSSDLLHIHPGTGGIPQKPGVLIHVAVGSPLLIVEDTGNERNWHYLDLATGQRIQISDTTLTWFSAWKVVQKNIDDTYTVFAEFAL